MKKLILCAATLLAMTTFVACDDDDNNALPSYMIDFVDAVSNSDAKISSITTDAGKMYVPTSSISANTADTTYRCVCTYYPEESATGETLKAKIYNITAVFANNPLPHKAFEKTYEDPLNVTSIWLGGTHINMVLEKKTTDAGTHKYAFREDTLTNEGGKNTAYFTVLHQQPLEDAESYSETVYLSMPLTNYPDADSIVVSINTYTGKKQFGFTY